MKFAHALLLLILVVVIAAAAYLFLAPGATDFLKPAKTITKPEEVNETVIAFVGAPYKDDYGTLRVPGYVDNLTKSEIRAATLRIQLLDNKGNKKEKITQVVTDIRPSSRKTFDINVGTKNEDRKPSVSVTKVEVVQQ